MVFDRALADSSDVDLRRCADRGARWMKTRTNYERRGRRQADLSLSRCYFRWRDSDVSTAVLAEARRSQPHESEHNKITTML